MVATAEAKQSLKVQGFTANGHVVFNYENAEQGLNQSFGINLKKYLAKAKKEPMNQNEYATKIEYELDKEAAEGLYTFNPNWRDPLPKLFGKLDENVAYQRGKLVEQWTIKFDSPETLGGPEQGIVRVRFLPKSAEIIEFDVELT